MYVCVAVFSGLLGYVLNLLCEYDSRCDTETEKSGRGSYFFKMNKGRGILLAGCLLSGAGLAWLFAWYGYGPLKAVRYLLLLSVLYPIAKKDAEEKIIPNRWLLYILSGRAVLFLAEKEIFIIHGPSSIILKRRDFPVIGRIPAATVWWIS